MKETESTKKKKFVQKKLTKMFVDHKARWLAKRFAMHVSWSSHSDFNIARRPARRLTTGRIWRLARDVTWRPGKVVLICASEMKEFMKMTSETLYTTRTWYEVENGSNGSCNFVFSSGPQVFSGSSVPKHGVKVRIFSRDFIDKCIFTRVKTCFHPGENEVIYFV